MAQKVLLDCGSGGRASHRLITGLFLKYLGNPELNRLNDAACLNLTGPLAMSTDTFTVAPIFFPGGNIGSLAVHGTVNDVSMLGAVPRYMACGFVIEEGFDLDALERIVAAMGAAAEEAGVEIVTGDTKVMPRGAVDGVLINTTGVGEIFANPVPAGDRARPGDAILLTGTMGDHGLAILSTRQGLSLDTPILSDAASLNHAIIRLLRAVPEVHVLRDPTRGGLATTVNEIAAASNVGCELFEDAIPVRPEVRGACSILGLDPLYLANEGKFLCVLPETSVDAALAVLRDDPCCAGAAAIGRVTDVSPGKVTLTTSLGGRRLLGMLEGEQLPRIC